jgi:serine/threonine protein kinase
VASLNHPHICVLHDIGNQDGTGYMVMEHLEGETLAARIARGALPFDQALQLATQIADALDRAHRAGVTHRDVKPANCHADPGWGEGARLRVGQVRVQAGADGADSHGRR